MTIETAYTKPFDAPPILDNGGAVLNLKHRRFGAKGDGITDDTAAIQACFDAAAASGIPVYIPEGEFRFASQLVVSSRIEIVGAGLKAALVADVGVATDAVVVNPGGFGVYLYRLRWRGFSILGEAASCKNALVISRCHLSEFDIVVRAGAAEWGTVVTGCLISRFRIITSINYTPPYIEQTNATMPTLGAVKMTVADGNMPCNANEFDFIIEGGLGAGARVEDQLNQGNNRYWGTIEGVGGQGFYMTGCRGPHIANLHMETNVGFASEIANSSDVTVGPGVLVEAAGTAGQLKITNCKSTKIDGVILDTLVIDENCVRTTLGQITYNVSGGSSTITDLSGEAVWVGPFRDASTATQLGVLGGGAMDPHNLLEGGTFEYWPGGDAAAPQGWAHFGNAPAWQKTGDGLVDTRRHFSRYAAKVTIAASTDLPVSELDWETVKGRWVVLDGWIYVPTGQPDVALQLWLTGGASVLSGPAVSTKDAFVRLQAAFYCDPAQSSANLALAVGAPASFYLANFSAFVGSIGVQAFVPPRNVVEDLFLNGQRVTFAPSVPSIGTYRAGDVVLNSNPVVAGAGGSQYIVAGWKRLTTGAAHVLNTDWVSMRTLTGT